MDHYLDYYHCYFFSLLPSQGELESYIENEDLLDRSRGEQSRPQDFYLEGGHLKGKSPGDEVERGGRINI